MAADSIRDESVAVQLLEQRLCQLERQFEAHCKAQNGHLAAIDATLGKLAEVIGQNRNERSEQVAALATRVEEQFQRLLLTTVGLLVPVLAGAIWVIFGHVLSGK